MKLSDITVEEVLEGKSWVMLSTEDSDPEVREAVGFTNEDLGLFSAVVKIADGTEHLGLVVKSFPQDGDDVDIYIYTRFGWMNIHTDGFLRAIGKYSHDLFPFDYHLANPWKGGGALPEPEQESDHQKVFRDTAIRIRKMPPPPPFGRKKK